MNGAESLVATLVAGGINVCFTNPGTSEMHFVAALDKVDGIRCVLGLFEGVVDGSSRRLLAHGRQVGGHPAPSGSRARQRAGPISTMRERPARHRQHRG